MSVQSHKALDKATEQIVQGCAKPMDNTPQSWRYFIIAALTVISAGVLKTLIMDRGWKPETD